MQENVQELQLSLLLLLITFFVFPVSRLTVSFRRFFCLLRLMFGIGLWQLCLFSLRLTSSPIIYPDFIQNRLKQKSKQHQRYNFCKTNKHNFIFLIPKFHFQANYLRSELDCFTNAKFETSYRDVFYSVLFGF